MKHKIRTWLQLYDRLGKQSLSRTRDQRIILKRNGKSIPLHLKYNENGNEWWLEEEDNNEDLGR